MLTMYAISASPPLQANPHHPRRRRATGEPTPSTSRSRRAPPPSTTSSRLSAPPNPGFRQQRSPPDMGLKGFTWVQNQFPKPDTSAGHVAARVIPGPKPVSTLANSLAAATGVLCSAKGIPPQSLRATATVPDVELFGADPVRAESGTQQ